ncbi:hypothetical protein [Aminobacter sp. BE322]|uniref:hypothetical protein n=1 Tax=unclassified Aminobacter TaxID=2644704 RepID=UPI003D1C1050
MTPELLGEWLLPVALAACILGGLAIVFVSVRTGWVKQAISWATVSFGLIGAVMILSPKWTTFAIEWGDLKATVAKLQDENRKLAAENGNLTSQIAQVSSLARSDFASAQDAVTSILNTRNAVAWADFLPATPEAYRLEISPENSNFAAEIAAKLNTSPTDVTKAFETSGYTLLKLPTPTDLKNSPAKSLWVTPREDFSGQVKQ